MSTEGEGNEFDAIASAHWKATESGALSVNDAIEAAEKTLLLNDERWASLDLERRDLNKLRSIVGKKLEEVAQRPVGTPSPLSEDEAKLYKGMIKRIGKAMKGREAPYTAKLSISGFEILKLRSFLAQGRYGTVTEHRVAQESQAFLDTVAGAYLSAPQKFEPVREKGVGAVVNNIKGKFQRKGK